MTETKENFLVYDVDRWHWMMAYCKNNALPPAQKWAWDRAANAYENFINNKIAE